MVYLWIRRSYTPFPTRQSCPMERGFFLVPKGGGITYTGCEWSSASSGLAEWTFPQFAMHSRTGNGDRLHLPSLSWEAGVCRVHATQRRYRRWVSLGNASCCGKNLHPQQSPRCELNWRRQGPPENERLNVQTGAMRAGVLPLVYTGKIRVNIPKPLEWSFPSR